MHRTPISPASSTQRFAVLLGLSVLFLLVVANGCRSEAPPPLPPPIDRDLVQVEDRDTLVVLTSYNSTSYFLYRGQAMGFEYDLLQAFAEARDLALKVVVVPDRDSLYYLLNRGVGDVIAARVMPRAVDSADVAFTRSLYETPPTLVQQSNAGAALPASADSLIDHAVDAMAESIPAIEDVPDSLILSVRPVARPRDLGGRTVYAPGNSAFVDRLVELQDSITGDIEVVEVGGDVSNETLIRLVSGGKINLAVAPLNLASLKQSYFTNVVTKPVIGEPFRVAWGVRKNAPLLHAALDSFIANNPGMRRNLYEKYFQDRTGYRERLASAYLTGETGTLSEYDDLLKKGAESIGWDWRLLASQAYQESRFIATAKSWAGATGLLQLMPATAREFGVRNMNNPEENVEGAVRFLQWLNEYWAEYIPDEQERLRFILASYNTGHGHVQDARRLAEKNGDDPNKWEDVAYWLLQKSRRAVYTDPVVKYGFARGLEPVTYVSRILARFDHYQQFVTEEDQQNGTNAQAEARGRS